MTASIKAIKTAAIAMTLLDGREELALDPLFVDDIRENGVQVPLMVAPSGEKGKFVLVDGRQRFRAAQVCEMDSVPCIVLDKEAGEDIGTGSRLNAMRMQDDEIATAHRIVALKAADYKKTEICGLLRMSPRTYDNVQRLVKLIPRAVTLYRDGKVRLCDLYALSAWDADVQEKRLAKDGTVDVPTAPKQEKGDGVEGDEGEGESQKARKGFKVSYDEAVFVLAVLEQDEDDADEEQHGFCEALRWLIEGGEAPNGFGEKARLALAAAEAEAESEKAEKKAEALAKKEADKQAKAAAKEAEKAAKKAEKEAAKAAKAKS